MYYTLASVGIYRYVLNSARYCAMDLSSLRCCGPLHGARRSEWPEPVICMPIGISVLSAYIMIVMQPS